LLNVKQEPAYEETNKKNKSVMGRIRDGTGSALDEKYYRIGRGGGGAVLTLI